MVVDRSAQVRRAGTDHGAPRPALADRGASGRDSSQPPASGIIGGERVHYWSRAAAMPIGTRRILMSLAASSILLGGAAAAQPERAPGSAASPERPRIGLVLSGGGARGGAHIGVLRALEELRVPIDYIAGTSIGAIIGGLYASGKSPAELEQIIRTIDWDAAFLNATPRRFYSFRRKRDDDLFLVAEKPGLNRRQFDLPVGLVQGQVMDQILARLLLPVATVEDFDRLRIPFRAVAADIASGEAVVLGSGNLARSIRASMSLPAAIAPVEIDGRLLVDGGIAMNLPVEVARGMGADVIIAIDLTAALRTREQLQSVLDVTTQLTNLLTRQGVRNQTAQLDAHDLLFEPQFVEDLSSVSFARMPEAIDVGYQMIMEHRAELEPLALDAESYARYRASLPDPRFKEMPRIDFVRLNNNSPIADRVIEARLHDIKIGAPLDVDAVERAIDKVYGLEAYQNVNYEVVTEGERTGLQINLEQRSWGPAYLQLGMQYSSSGDQAALFGLAASYLDTAINSLGGEWRTTLEIGDEPAFKLDLYQPFGRDAAMFVAPAVKFTSTLYDVFSGEDALAELRLREASLEFAVGRNLASWGEVRGGVRGSTGDIKARVGDPVAFPDATFRKGEWFVKLAADTVDSVAFPRSGVLASGEWRASRSGLSADSNFEQLLISGLYAHTWGRYTLLSSMRYDATISGEAPLESAFRLGGFFDLSGLNPHQLTGQEVVRVGASFYRRIGNLALFPAFAGISLEVGNAWDNRADVNLSEGLVGGSAWAGVDTPIGPVYVGYGLAEGGRDAFYVFLGRAF
jgi:NTE family protein